jgi:predicted glutamine amidotransferase
MCRLLGVVSNEATDFRFSLHEAPRSLAALSHAHPDGWGLAVHSAGGWELHKHAACAGIDDRFGPVVATAHGEILIAHIRKKTVGGSSIANTHPFRQGTWVFAHNGTIEDRDFLREGTSAPRLAEIHGETDSEMLFAYLLTAIDGAGGTGGAAAAQDAVDRAITHAVTVVTGRPEPGASNFLLSDGKSLYVHRFGRTLFILERGVGDEVRLSRRSRETDATVETPWSVRRNAVLIASEHMTDEPWQELGEKSLVRIDRSPYPSSTWRFLRRGDG